MWIKNLVFIGSLALCLTPLFAQGATSTSCSVSEDRTMSDGTEKSLNKQIPDFTLSDKKCAAPNCTFSDASYKPELFPNIEVDVEADTLGKIYVDFYDRGDLNPAKGKKAYTHMSAWGSNLVLGSYEVTTGDDFPLKASSITISCQSK